jgi:hypothetical protein
VVVGDHGRAVDERLNGGQQLPVAYCGRHDRVGVAVQYVVTDGVKVIAKQGDFGI